MSAERISQRREHLRPVDLVSAAPLWAPLRWDSIVGGWLIGLAFFAFLSLLGIATGLTAVNTGAAAATGSGPSAADIGRNSMIWTGVCSIISFLLGGYFAARMVNLPTRERGAMNGLMVFLVAVPFMLIMGALSATGVVSGLGGLAGGLFAGATQAATTGVPPQQVTGTITPDQMARAAETTRNAAWSGLAIGLICLAVSTIGGWFGATPGTRYEDLIDVE